ncbi:MAG: NAD-dependent dihydropyrimidine dehydrogenase subunit PreA [Desulfotomaculaceae bacterium]
MKIEGNADLTVDFCGLRLPNPFLLASAPPTADAAMIKRAFALGWGGAVTKTIPPDGMVITDVSPRLRTLRNNKGTVLGLENIELISHKPLSLWLAEIRDIKHCFPQNLLIASLMAEVRKERWQEMSVSLQKAGADALELNFSCPHGMPEKGLGSAIGQDEELTRLITSWVKEVVSIPVIVKLSPNVTDIGLLALAAEKGGADGLAAINTVQCLVAIDLDTFEPQPSVNGFSTFGGLSGPAVKPIGLRCVAQIAQTSRLPISGMGGISSWKEAAEYILVGASSVQICTEVMLRGYGIIKGMKEGLTQYLKSKGLSDLDSLRALALPKLVSHESLDRNYRVWPLIDKQTCNACGRCVVACRDAGSNALLINNSKLTLDDEACSGCSLCINLCHLLKAKTRS